MSRIISAFAVAASLGLAACGTSPSERGVSGAGIGAGTGAAASAILGGPIWGGALLGGAVGGATGALTSPNTVDLGKPVWDR